MSARREHPPVPGKLHVIPVSSLRGMERPVRSFKSFIRTTPSHPVPDDNKPLPPTPITPKRPVPTISLASIQDPSGQSTSDTPWRVFETWDNPSALKQDFQASPFSIARSHGPLLPEPSPGIADIEEPRPWPFNLSNSKHTHLAPRDGYFNSKSSPLQLRDHASPSASADILTSSPNSAPSNRLSITDSTVVPPKVSVDVDMRPASTSPPPDVALRVSNLSTKQKAFASLETDTGDQDAMREQWADLFNSTHTKDDFLPYLSIQGKKLEPPSHQTPKHKETSGGTNIGENLQQLSISQDYHNVPADHYQDFHSHSMELLTSEDPTTEPLGHFLKNGPKPPSKQRELIPRPLSWRKDSASSSSGHPDNSASTTQASAVRRDVGARKRYRKMPSWVPHHKPTQELERSDFGKEKFHPRRLSAVSVRKQNPGLDVGRPKKKDMHFSGLVPHIKDLISNAKRSRVSNGANTGRSTSTSASEPRSPHVSSSSGTSIPLLRLPGGLALVRQSPAPTLSQSTSQLDVLQRLELPQWNSYSDFSGYGYPAKRQLPQPAVAPAVAINKKFRTSISSAPSLHLHSNTSSPPTSPLAHEVALPRTPPQLPPPPKLPPTFSSWSRKSTELMRDDRADSATEEEPQKRGFHLGILEKARDVHEAWKRHNKDAKHAKLKQSIRVLGPTDPSVAAGYVKREGRVSLLDGKDRSRMPGYMASGPL